MRSRKEIEEYVKQDEVVTTYDGEIQTELLLDIRELLQQLLRKRK